MNYKEYFYSLQGCDIHAGYACNVLCRLIGAERYEADKELILQCVSVEAYQFIV
jgi:hypothetical protein